MLEADGGERGVPPPPFPLICIQFGTPTPMHGMDRAPIPIAASTCSAR